MSGDLTLSLVLFFEFVNKIVNKLLISNRFFVILFSYHVVLVSSLDYSLVGLLCEAELRGPKLAIAQVKTIRTPIVVWWAEVFASGLEIGSLLYWLVTNVSHFVKSIVKMMFGDGFSCSENNNMQLLFIIIIQALYVII